MRPRQYLLLWPVFVVYLGSERESVNKRKKKALSEKVKYQWATAVLTNFCVVPHIHEYPGKSLKKDICPQGPGTVPKTRFSVPWSKSCFKDAKKKVLQHGVSVTGENKLQL